MKIESTTTPAIPAGQLWSIAAPEPATELELQCWELWALSASDVAWFLGVTLLAAAWVLVFR